MCDKSRNARQTSRYENVSKCYKGGNVASTAFSQRMASCECSIFFESSLQE